MAYLLTEREEYNYCIQRGFEPLLDTRNFTMKIELRVEIQKEIFGHCIFGRGNIPASNERFYRWIWEHKKHICEETMKPLLAYSAKYISHILTRGSCPEMALDPRNTNVLSFESHNLWENGEREKMRIYPGNLITIDLLKTEYRLLL